MTILGINAYHADSSAAIIVDGKLIAATEEERFTRVKHWAGFPAQAILFCLKEAGITLNEVDHIAIGRDPKAKLAKKAFYILKNPAGGIKTVLNRLQNSKKVSSLEKEFSAITGIPEETIKPKINQVLNIFPGTHCSYIANFQYVIFYVSLNIRKLLQIHSQVI